MTFDYQAPTQPDILEVIADLSNDEVRTPPSVANAVLDLLPAEVWTDSTLRWLDPGVKTGVFLREITKRLLVGLAAEIPDEEKRLEHILKNQVFGIAITELTALMGRRTLYCSKDASSDISIVKMNKPSGNLWFDRTRHLFAKGRCTVCGASQGKFDSETNENYAYAFIHEYGRQLYQEEHDMNFDIIVGNPPYQMEADAAGQNIVPIYQKFVDFAIQLNPRYLSFVIPSRWMAGGRGLEEFRDQMLQGGKLRKLIDFPNASDIFSNVEIKGGVCYFLWDREGSKQCETQTFRTGELSTAISRDLSEFDVLVRDFGSLQILRKVLGSENFQPLTDIVSARDPFGPGLGSNLKDFRELQKKKPQDLVCYINIAGKRKKVAVDKSLVTKNTESIEKWKVFMPRAGSDGGQKLPDIVMGRSEISSPGEVCTATFLVVGGFDSESAAKSVESYLRTRFARFLLSLRKITQNTTQNMFNWVPIQKWDREWTDSELYEMYGISSAEQLYIESMVKEMPA
jgi:site-specific DNA-methyltransferase (adenine-specific)